MTATKPGDFGRAGGGDQRNTAAAADPTANGFQAKASTFHGSRPRTARLGEGVTATRPGRLGRAGGCLGSAGPEPLDQADGGSWWGVDQANTRLADDLTASRF